MKTSILMNPSLNMDFRTGKSISEEKTSNSAFDIIIIIIITTTITIIIPELEGTFTKSESVASAMLGISIREEGTCTNLLVLVHRSAKASASLNLFKSLAVTFT
jgi:hypothetical protein